MQVIPGNSTQSSRLRYVAAMISILLMGALFRIFHFHLSIGGDDQTWVITARELFTRVSEDVIRDAYYSRILFRCVLAAWGWMFGFSLESACVLMFLLNAATTVMVSQCAKLTFGAGAGLAAAAIYATHPLLVVYDVVTRPDQLALLFLASYLLCFLKYLRDRRMRWLLVSAFLIGMSYSVKEYYILPAAPFAACLLFQQEPWAKRIRMTLVFTVIVILGLSTDVLLHVWQSGNAAGTFGASADYPDILLERERESFAKSLILRTGYLKWLFFDAGIFSGFATLWGLAFLVFSSRKRLDCFSMLGAFLMFLVFMMFMFVSLRPLVFVEIQKRYMDALVLILSIGAGGALAATFASLSDKRLRSSLFAAVLLGIASNIVSPNDLLDPRLPRYQTLEFDGLARVVERSAQAGINELILPDGYQRRVPDSFYHHGVKIAFREVNDMETISELVEYMKADTTRSVFIPRKAIRAKDKLWSGEYERRWEYVGMYHELAESLESLGCSAEKVRVPSSALASWLEFFGGSSLGDPVLVAWTYRFDTGTDQAATSTRRAD